MPAAPTAATLTFGINGGTAGSTVIDGVTYDVSRAGPYGTLYVDSTTGAYTFVPDNNAINALIEPTTTDFTITVSDGTLSARQPFTIAINGTNDAAIISGATDGTAIETGSVANTALGPLSATGTLTSTDVDDTPNAFAAVSTPTESAHGFGTFTMTTAGVWTYTVNDANSAVQALNVGDKLTDSFTVTTIDGTPQVVSVTINGANDAAVISGTTTGSVIEDGGTKCDVPTATGTLTATDVDNAAGFTAVNCPTASDAGYGTFTMTADGVWIYKLDDSNCAVQALNVGDTLTDTFKVTSLDGTAQLVTVTINGTNDAAIICGTKEGSVIEAGGAANSISCKPTATGTLTDTDVDNTPNTFTAIDTPKASTGGYGTFTMTTDGVWTYTLDNTNCKVQALNVCDSADRLLYGDHHRRHPAGGDDHHQRRQRRRRHLRHNNRLGNRSWRLHIRHADRNRHAHQYRRRQHAQYVHGSMRAEGERERLWHFHHDGGWRLDLQARQRQLRGAGPRRL